MRPGSWAMRLLVMVFAGIGLTSPAWAHVGGKDVFEQVDAGPYKLFVTVRMPTVIPGVATVEVRSSGAAVGSIQVTPVPLMGEASKHPPIADPMQRSRDDPAFFTGSLWLMTSGPWQVRLQVEGSGGPATAGVPVAAMALSILPMQRSLGAILAALGVILTLGMAGIVASAVREARLAPGVTPRASRRRGALIAGVATLVVMVAGLSLGDKWWKVEAANYAKDIYHPSDMHVALTGGTLHVTIGNFNERQKRWKAQSLDEFMTDHGHIMHLYAIRFPGMDAAYHLHPEPVSSSGDGKELATVLPTMPPGTYRLYADVVYRNGFPETLTSDLTVPSGLEPALLAPEDASALPPPLAKGELGTAYKLPDGYTMVWDRPTRIDAGKGFIFHFRLLDAAGRPAADMQPYLGMAGHAAFVKTDGSAFAHTHPEGSAAMPSMMLANASTSGAPSGEGGAEDMPGMGSETAAMSPDVDFPYGFPSAGRYRIFIQMKHGGVVETGVFDADVL